MGPLMIYFFHLSTLVFMLTLSDGRIAESLMISVRSYWSVLLVINISCVLYPGHLVESLSLRSIRGHLY